MGNKSTKLLLPLSAIYRLVTETRLALFESGILKKITSEKPVISVGNITTGGTGKTPIVIWIASALADAGFKPCILSRGYGREDPRSRLLVSDSQTINSDARRAGDEPLLIAEALRGRAAVVCDPDRSAAAIWASHNLDVDVFILDDGFQHVKLNRDLNILLVDATNPFGGGHLLPAGRLREPLSKMSRADVILLTRTDNTPNISEVREIVRKHSPETQLLHSKMEITGLAPIDPAKVKMNSENLGSLSAGAFCGVGNPGSFFSDLNRVGLKLKLQQSFNDHHRYKEDEIQGLYSQMSAAGVDTVVTTEKDGVKLRGVVLPIPTFTASSSPVFEEEDLLREMVIQTVRTRMSRDQQTFRSD